jgi:hypothetical protein
VVKNHSPSLFKVPSLFSPLHGQKEKELYRKGGCPKKVFISQISIYIELTELAGKLAEKIIKWGSSR